MYVLRAELTLINNKLMYSVNRCVTEYLLFVEAKSDTEC